MVPLQNNSEINKFIVLWRRYWTRLSIFLSYGAGGGGGLNLGTIVIDSLKLIFPYDVFVGVSDRIQCHFLARKMTEINESARAHFTKPLNIASMIAVQVVIISFGFQLRECMESCCPPPPSRLKQCLIQKYFL